MITKLITSKEAWEFESLLIKALDELESLLNVQIQFSTTSHMDEDGSVIIYSALIICR